MESAISRSRPRRRSRSPDHDLTHTHSLTLKSERGLSQAAAAKPAEVSGNVPWSTLPAHLLRSETLCGPLGARLVPSHSGHAVEGTLECFVTNCGCDPLRSGTLCGPRERAGARHPSCGTGVPRSQIRIRAQAAGNARSGMTRHQPTFSIDNYQL